MNSTNIKFRSFNAGCAHEIVLPNGKVILIDPYFTGDHMEGHSKDEITGADYILITHSHFDHELDLGYFVKKFNSKVFIGALSAFAVLKYHKIPYDNVYPVYPGQKFVLDDFKLDVFQGKHNPTGAKIFAADDEIAMDYIGVSGHKECDDWGYIESTGFMITTNNSFSIIIMSGQTLTNDIFDWCKEKAPNMLLRQAGVRRDGAGFSEDAQVSSKELAELCVKYHSQLIIPFHMDVIYKRWGIEKTEAYFRDVAREVQNLDPGAIFILPEAWEWYDIGLNVSVELPAKISVGL